MGPLEFSPDRSSPETYPDRQADLREALVGELELDRTVYAGERSQPQRQEVPQFERAGAFSSVAGAWSSVFGSPAQLTAAIVRLSAVVGVNTPRENTSRPVPP